MNVHPGVSQILSVVPKRPRGKPHPAQEEAYLQWMRDWANGILRLKDRPTPPYDKAANRLRLGRAGEYEGGRRRGTRES